MTIISLTNKCVCYSPNECRWNSRMLYEVKSPRVTNDS